MQISYKDDNYTEVLRDNARNEADAFLAEQ